MTTANSIKFLFIVIVFQYHFLSLAQAATVLNGSAMSPIKSNFYFGADVESFVNKPADFSRWTDGVSTDSNEFKNLLDFLGKPTLRFASLQRWDWRGEKETLALITSPEYHKIRRQNGMPGAISNIGYNFVTAQSFYDFNKINEISTIPMLDVRIFYDAVAGNVKEIPKNTSLAANQYAAGYANFIKKNGYDVPFWEIGNEEYMTKYQYSAEDYARVVRAYINAVLKINPDAKFGIQLYLFNFHPEWRVWSEKVLDNLKEYSKHIDYACLHYYGDGIFSDPLTGDAIKILRSKGFTKTKVAVTEWRHSANPDTFDQEFRSASLFSRFLMFMVRHPDIDFACVHAFPFYGGLAEWSNGTTWTSYGGKGPGILRKDSVGKPRWRLLPFGMSQRMIMDATRGNRLVDYKENPKALSLYLFSKPSGGYSLIVINEASNSVFEEVHIRSVKSISSYSGKELINLDQQAFPSDTEPQPWQIVSINSNFNDKAPKGSIILLKNGVLNLSLRPHTVMTFDLK